MIPISIHYSQAFLLSPALEVKTEHGTIVPDWGIHCRHSRFPPTVLKHCTALRLTLVLACHQEAWWV